MKTLFHVLVGACFLIALSVQAELVYDNSLTPLSPIRFNPGTNEVGDEIVLGGTGRTVTDFIFEYYMNPTFSGNEAAQIRFYINDGQQTASGPFAPNTLFWDSGLFSIAPTNGATLVFNSLTFNGQPVVAPDSFTWSVQFFGIEPGESAGVDRYSPPTVGNNYHDYWDFADGAWSLRTNMDGSAMSFGARIEAVPEPASLALGIVTGILGWAWLRRFRAR